MNEQLSAIRERVKPRFEQLMIVVVGIVLGQAVLYGPSLLGRKVLLPLDILDSPNTYLPQTPDVGSIRAHNLTQADLVFQCEPQRRFGVEEIQAGRLPLWTPYQFAGTPFFWPKFSPLFLLQCSIASPVVLAWAQLLAALIAGLGAYFFFRRALGVSFWPATIASWCYPLTAFFVLWQGAPPCQSVYWLPWILLAVNATARRTHPLALIGLSAMTALVLISGQLDGAAQVLLASGLYGGWCWLDAYRRQWFARPAQQVAWLLVMGWGLGILLAAPAILPVVEYAQTGSRVARRSAGEEERPPVGLVALPQVVLPRMYGTSERGSLPLAPKGQGNLQESTAAAYTGLLTTLLVAPLAFGSRRHRSGNWFWVALAFVGLSWCLNVPGAVQLLRLPGLNMVSHSRFVFASSFAILALAAVGLEVLWRKEFQWHGWFWLPFALLAGLCSWCVYRAVVLPEPIRTQLGAGLAEGKQSKWVRDLADVSQVQSWFSQSFTVMAILCGLGMAGWLILFLWRRKIVKPWFMCLLGMLLAADLIWFGYGRSAQCDTSLYYPRLPVLEELRKSPPGRIIGFNCLPALLGVSHDLRDIRGYDGVDPARMVALLGIGRDPRSPNPDYAFAQGLIPKAGGTPTGDIRLSPILDMLNVRYVIFRGSPDPADRPLLRRQDYFVLENRSALPRVFIPRRVEVVTDDKARLEKLALPAFDARAVAYVESPVDLPAAGSGTAEVVEEIPTCITVALRMENPGLIVLADRWDPGWRAYWNGNPTPILRVNHAIRGVVVPAGDGTLEFRYEPASFAWGLRLAGLAAVALLVWVCVIIGKASRTLPAG